MRWTSLLSVVVMAGCLTALPDGFGAQAQIREQQPAEFPPASYKGKQYVDSQGCVFIRAGIDGAVTWVPRVSRDRKVVCGFQPTVIADAQPQPAAPAVDTAIVIEPDTTSAAPDTPVVTAKAPPPAPKSPSVAPRRAAPVIVRQTAPRRPAPVIVRPTMDAPVVATGPADTACPGASAMSQHYMRGSGVRCGAQAEPVIIARVAQPDGSVAAVRVPSGATVATNALPIATEVTATTRIVPKHVAINRINTRHTVVPKGYRQVWEDDRLNPYRAEQNLQGRGQMLLIWTQTVPRRLINQSTGKDVTASTPLIYPYTTIEQQRRELGEVQIVQRDGQIVKKIVRNPSTKVVKRKPVYSSRSKPAETASAVTGPARYVQIGRYDDAGQAQRAARSVAQMGMAARIGKHRRGGERYHTVQAGPFTTTQALQKAMRRLQSAGYQIAVTR